MTNYRKHYESLIKKGAKPKAALLEALEIVRLEKLEAEKRQKKIEKKQKQKGDKKRKGQKAPSNLASDIALVG